MTIFISGETFKALERRVKHIEDMRFALAHPKVSLFDKNKPTPMIHVQIGEVINPPNGGYVDVDMSEVIRMILDYLGLEYESTPATKKLVKVKR